MTDKQKSFAWNVIPIVVAILVAIIPVVYAYGANQSRLDIAEKKIEKLEGVYEKIATMSADIRELTTKFNLMYESQKSFYSKGQGQ
jgi:hypothetical protein